MNFQLHFKMIYASVNKFWDRVPIGRIVNRLTSDADKSDFDLAGSSNALSSQVLQLLIKSLLLCYTSSQLLWICIVGQTVLSWFVYNYFIKAKREIQRLQSILRSPVNQMYSEAMNGMSNIRIFKKQKKVMEDFFGKIDSFRSASQLLFGIDQWLHIRFQFMSMLIVVPGFILVCITKPPIGIIAVLLINILTITDNVQSMLNSTARWEANFVAWERCCKYMDVEPEVGYNDMAQTEYRHKNGLPICPEWKEKQIQQLEEDFDDNEQIQPAQSKEWPRSGTLQFENYSVRYRPDLDPVLKNLSVTIESGQKVGIVGRTGAGKTTLISSIYRSFQEYEGEIRFDGREISSMDLKTLRRNITVIPQDPHLFNDTIRANLDPLNQYSSSQIVKILKDFEIWEKFQEKNQGLEYMIENEGQNLSQGEKQLLCMARALLNQNKLILLDEATANIDVITEVKIQNAIENFFKDSTVIIVAHRLNTIMNCDKVWVLDKGSTLEFDYTEELKRDKNSVFGRMCAVNNDIKKYME